MQRCSLAAFITICQNVSLIFSRVWSTGHCPPSPDTMSPHMTNTSGRGGGSPLPSKPGPPLFLPLNFSSCWGSKSRTCSGLAISQQLERGYRTATCLSVARPPVLPCPWTQQRQYTLFSIRISRIKPCSPGHSCYSSYWRLLRCSRKGLGDCLVTSPPLHSHTAGRVTARWVIPAIRIRATTWEKSLFLIFKDLLHAFGSYSSSHSFPWKSKFRMSILRLKEPTQVKCPWTEL